MDEDVYPTERRQCGFDDGRSPGTGGTTLVACDCVAAGGLDFAHHRLGRRFAVAAEQLALGVRAKVVHHHPGAACGELQCVVASETIAGAGDDGHAAVVTDGLGVNGRRAHFFSRRYSGRSISSIGTRLRKPRRGKLYQPEEAQAPPSQCRGCPVM